MRRLGTVIVFAATLLLSAAPASAVMRTVCPALCNHTRIQDALNASGSGDFVWIQSTYNSVAAGETFPLNTLQVPSNLTIQGEGVNSSGIPTTTIAITTNPGQPDGLIINTPGTVIKNLRFVPTNSTPILRVIASADRITFRHVNTLTIDNVVIDWTGGNAGNGLGLLADNVTIQNSTFRMISGNAIFVDGDNYLIQNNTLNSLDAGNVVRGALAIGFGADEKVPPSFTVCSGFPTGYAILNNVISGFVDGIQWCSGRDNVLLGNQLSNISGRAIDTSGSVRTTIGAFGQGNIITYTATGGTHGIGLTANSFQGCDGNIVEYNQVIGRPARDLQRGIVMQNCTNSRLRYNTLRFFGAGNAIFYAMGAGLPTFSLIQGNTVQAGSANGIAYLGSDGGGTTVDRTQILDNIVEEHTLNGIIAQGIKAPGGAVVGNTVRAVNQSGQVNTHAFNLQNLQSVLIDRNTALATQAPGLGFFLANSLGLGGTCNTGVANGGGLLAQVGVSPAFTNPVLNCRVGYFNRHDFDGDGRADVAVYRTTTGQWFVFGTSAGVISVGWGSPALDDVPVPANYTIASQTDIAVFRFATSEWFILRSPSFSPQVVVWGASFVGDVPVPADFDGDGRADIAVYRVTTGEWFIRRSSDGGLMYVAFGCPGCIDVPIPADFDGDGKADVAVYRRSTAEWFIRKSSDLSLKFVAFGAPALGDVPVPGNYTSASGPVDLAVYRTISGQWFILPASGAPQITVQWGSPANGDIPVPGNYSQPGLTEVAVYRTTNGQWWIRRASDLGATMIGWGDPASLDVPLTGR
jgi:hypothetical protein